MYFLYVEQAFLEALACLYSVAWSSVFISSWAKIGAAIRLKQLEWRRMGCSTGNMIG